MPGRQPALVSAGVQRPYSPLALPAGCQTNPNVLLQCWAVWDYLKTARATIQLISIIFLDTTLQNTCKYLLFSAVFQECLPTTKAVTF